MALTTTAAAKTHLGITDTSEDAFLAQLLPAVEAAFLKAVDRDIVSTAYVEYYSGRGTPVILLREYPVTTVAGVWLDSCGFWGTGENAFAADTQLTEGTDFVVMKDGRGAARETGRLYRIGAVWPGRLVRPSGLLCAKPMPGAGNVKVSYTAGYATVPTDIQLAVWQLCGEMLARRTDGRLPSSERFEDYAITYEAATEAAMQRDVHTPGSVASVISAYRRITPRFEPHS